MSTTDIPSAIRLKDRGHKLVLEYGGTKRYELSAEYLRVESPSAEVQGHFGQGGQLPVGKQNVAISNIERSGHYAVQLTFDDGHNSGIYTWLYLKQLAVEKDQRWRLYLEKLREQGVTRDAEVQVLRILE